MYRSDKLLSNGPRAAGETQVPISGLDRSIPFRSFPGSPGWAGRDTHQNLMVSMSGWVPYYLPSSFLPALELRTVCCRCSNRPVCLWPELPGGEGRRPACPGVQPVIVRN